MALGVASCHTYRYVPEGEHVLYKNQLDITMADSSRVPSEVKEALRDAKNYYIQKPNSKFLGIEWLRVGMTIYGIAHPKDNTFVGKYFRRLGQAPRVYDAEKASRTATQLERLMQTKGCFGSTVSFDTLKLGKHDISIGYHVTASSRYVIDEVNYRSDNTAVQRLLEDWAADSPLQAGNPYDQEQIAAERTRLTNNLREAGYFHATSNRIVFLVDTTYSPGRLSIDVLVDGSDLQVYHINNIYIYPNHQQATSLGTDTLIYTYPTPRRNVDFNFVYHGSMPVSPKTISRSLMLFPGMTYRPRYITNTYNSMLALRNFKFINIDFSESPSTTDTLPLVDAHLHLVSATRQRLSLSLELTNASPMGSSTESGVSNFLSGGNLGIETALEYRNRNLFGGAEQLRVKASLLSELPKVIFSGTRQGFYNNFDAFEAGLDASLEMPVLLLPFTHQLSWQRIKPHTLIGLGGSYQYRYYFERVLANISFGYTWMHSSHTTNQLLPLELTFVRMLSLDEAFAARLRSVNDLRMKYQYSSHFIMAARYDYNYSNQQYGTRQNFSALHLSAESAGNLLWALGSAMHAPQDTNGIFEMLGVPFSQYVRLGAEWTRYQYIGTKSTLVARVMVGVGLPYGNSLSMPYEKSFFGGGSTTLRAWQLRHLGPGSYAGADDVLERVGDLQLVLNIEHRFPIVSIVEGALFADAGNVWLLNSSSQYPGGEIKWSSIPTEVAVGVGIGIRLNVSIATLRADLAIPLYDPGYTSELRWRPPHWQMNQIVANLGINYPF